MAFDEQRVAASFVYDSDRIQAVEDGWRKLMGDSVFWDIKCSKIGALTRLRKRILEVGEGIRSFYADRSWIPQTRERLKSAIASSLNLRDNIQNMDRAVKLVDGGEDFAVFEKEYLEFRRNLLQFMESHESQWAELLEQGAYDYDDDEDEEAPEGK